MLEKVEKCTQDTNCFFCRNCKTKCLQCSCILYCVCVEYMQILLTLIIKTVLTHLIFILVEPIFRLVYDEQHFCCNLFQEGEIS